MAKIVIAALILNGCLWFSGAAAAAGDDGAAQRNEQEKTAVIAIFDAMTNAIFDNGRLEGQKCTFGKRWGRYVQGAIAPTIMDDKPFLAPTVISLQEAIDPAGRRPDMFCDHLSANDNEEYVLATYPNFNKNYDKATFYYMIEGDGGLSGAKGFHGAMHEVEMAKIDGVWREMAKKKLWSSQ